MGSSLNEGKRLKKPRVSLSLEFKVSPRQQKKGSILGFAGKKLNNNQNLQMNQYSLSILNKIRV